MLVTTKGRMQQGKRKKLVNEDSRKTCKQIGRTQETKKKQARKMLESKLVGMKVHTPANCEGMQSISKDQVAKEQDIKQVKSQQKKQAKSKNTCCEESTKDRKRTARKLVVKKATKQPSKMQQRKSREEQGKRIVKMSTTMKNKKASK